MLPLLQDMLTQLDKPQFSRSSLFLTNCGLRCWPMKRTWVLVYTWDGTLGNLTGAFQLRMLWSSTADPGGRGRGSVVFTLCVSGITSHVGLEAADLIASRTPLKLHPRQGVLSPSFLMTPSPSHGSDPVSVPLSRCYPLCHGPIMSLSGLTSSNICLAWVQSTLLMGIPRRVGMGSCLSLQPPLSSQWPPHACNVQDTLHALEPHYPHALPFLSVSAMFILQYVAHTSPLP